MFTGIVEELGEIVEMKLGEASGQLRIDGPLVASDAAHGASIAVNGACLTVVDVADATFTADVMRETLSRTTLGGLAAGAKVNLERAVRVNDRLGGHIVQGHVDGIDEVQGRTPGENWEIVRIGLPTELSRYVVEKGSIAVDGVSLTVSGVGDGWFEVGLIPTTLAATTLGHRQPGDWVNLEVDVVAKYVERLVAKGTA